MLDIRPNWKPLWRTALCTRPSIIESTSLLYHLCTKIIGADYHLAVYPNFRIWAKFWCQCHTVEDIERHPDYCWLHTWRTALCVRVFSSDAKRRFASSTNTGNVTAVNSPVYIAVISSNTGLPPQHSVKGLQITLNLVNELVNIDDQACDREPVTCRDVHKLDRCEKIKVNPAEEATLTHASECIYSHITWHLKANTLNCDKSFSA